MYNNKSIKCTATIGIDPGYFHKNKKFDSIDFYGFLQEFIEIEATKYRYIPFVVSKSRAIYSMAYGCPYGGEKVYTLTAVLNPKYETCTKSEWKDDCIKIIEDLKEKLEQTTVTVTFEDCDFYYLT